MDVFNLVRGVVEQALSQVMKFANVISSTQDRIKTYAQIISGAWIGGDEKAFEQEVMTVLIPMVVDFMNALVGINTNTAKAVSIMDSGDAQARAAVGRLRDVFQAI